MSVRKACIVVLVMAALACGAGAQETVAVFVDGARVKFDVPARMYGAWVFVPLRGVFEKMGAKVTFSKSTGAVTIVKEATRIRLKVGQSLATVNGSHVPMLTAPFEERGRVLVPLRFVSQALGCQVGWNPGLRTVTISSKAAEQNEYDIRVDGDE